MHRCDLSMDYLQGHAIAIMEVKGLTAVEPLLKNVDLSRLGNRCCPGFPTGNASPGQKRVSFYSGSGNRDKRGLFVPVGVLPAPTWLAHPFVPVGVTNRDKRSLFFMFSFSQFFFYFNYTFAFQLNLCIGIQCVWSPLIYTYIYIVTYIIFVLDSFHI